MYHILTFTF